MAKKTTNSVGKKVAKKTTNPAENFFLNYSGEKNYKSRWKKSGQKPEKTKKIFIFSFFRFFQWPIGKIEKNGKYKKKIKKTTNPAENFFLNYCGQKNYKSRWEKSRNIEYFSRFFLFSTEKTKQRKKYLFFSGKNEKNIYFFRFFVFSNDQSEKTKKLDHLELIKILKVLVKILKILANILRVLVKILRFL